MRSGWIGSLASCDDAGATAVAVARKRRLVGVDISFLLGNVTCQQRSIAEVHRCFCCVLLRSVHFLSPIVAGSTTRSTFVAWAFLECTLGGADGQVAVITLSLNSIVHKVRASFRVAPV